LQLLRTSISSTFQDGSKGTTDGAARKHVRGMLVAGEVTLAVVLLVGAALMGRTMLQLAAVDPGFRVDHVAVATVSLAGTPHAKAEMRDPMFQRVRDRLAALPGVRSASAINHLPLAGDMWRLGYTVEGRPAAPPSERSGAIYRIVQPGYFATMELRLMAGREFTAADSASAPLVAVVNKAMADRQWPSESPIGRRITLPGPGDQQSPITIVGVAANARQSDWTSAPEEEVYLPFAQRAGEFGLHTMTFVIRSSVDPATVAAAIPRELAALDRTVPVMDVGTMSAVVAGELWRERLTATLTGVFAMVALFLAAIGVYAVVAYSVARRTREFGVRVALGATARGVVVLALIEALRPVVIGAGAGLLLAVSLSKVTQTFLYDVSPLDPLALGGAVLVLLLVATGAALVPARRASRLDPVTALRRD
jgi:putative ABC transport system permease protein